MWFGFCCPCGFKNLYSSVLCGSVLSLCSPCRLRALKFWGLGAEVLGTLQLLRCVWFCSPFTHLIAKKHDLFGYIIEWPKIAKELQCGFMQFNFQDYAAQAVSTSGFLDFMRPMQSAFRVILRPKPHKTAVQFFTVLCSPKRLCEVFWKTHMLNILTLV